MTTLNANIITSPGVFVTENTAGIVPAELASFNRCYMLGTSANGPINTPYQVVSAEDFSNVFGSSNSLNAVTLFFRNHPNGILYFVRAASPQIAEVTVSGAVVGVWGLTIAVGDQPPVSISVDYADSSPTVQALLDQIIGAINTSAVSSSVTAYDPQPADSSFRIRGNTETIAFSLSAPTAPSGATLNKVDDITTLKDDFVWACENAFDADEHDQGLLIAPQSFQSLSSQSDRTAVAVAMENLCAREGYDWMSLVDCGNDVVTPAQLSAEASLYVSPRGHLAYFAPYLSMIDAGNTAVFVPPSPAVAAIGLLRFEKEGFNQPPAGVPYAIRGVVDVKVRIKRQQQSTLNPQGINIVRYLPNRGVVVYGSRTRSSAQDYRFITTRIILNVLIGTLRRSFDNFVFTAVDGRGVLFARIRQTAEAVCYRLWEGGALYGASPAEAFFVKCDSENNPNLDLEAGVVRLDVYVVPAPIAERIFISVTRLAIGQIQVVTRGIG